jgi:hypothetical protein
MKMKHYLLLAFVVGAVTFNGCKKDDGGTETETTTPTDAKAVALKDYKEMYLASSVSAFTWNGNTADCNAGTLSQDVLDKALLRLKYFRKAAGLSNDRISFSASFNTKCQQNALMIKANNAISHAPPTSWKCYSQAGADAAASGNIAYGSSDINNIQLWMEDGGSNNAEAGHRRWILYSRADVFGFGATNSSGTLWVFGNTGPSDPLPAKTPSYVAWPPKGFIPQNVVYNRWSLSVPAPSYPFQVDFTAATVVMKNATGANVPLTIDYANPIQSSYGGDNSIVWIPTGINLSASSDQKYSVKVANVKVGGVAKTYEYDVTIFKP